MSTSPATTPVLRADGLAAGYGGPDVVRGVDLELVPGREPVGIVGESGAGKSTIVAALVGQVRPTAGRVTWAGRTVTRIPLREKKRFRAQVRRVTQEGLDVDARWTVDRAVGAALTEARRAGSPSGATVAELLSDVALEPRFAPRTVGSLSGGERQRLALALALATRPAALLLDEPLTAVDPGMRGEVVRRLTEATAAAGTAVLLVSHDLELVERLCTTAHVLAEGTFVASGPLQEVLATSDHPAVRGLAEAAPLAVQRFA
ncbi:ATP-binding cassette domain-containing protein [Isoptericola variabilis]|uniref:ABC transporter related protein n=1 Tax=Isoptericola variabilis (strain 225) TaxID=743718 RepID=F6FU86_ISOV2|nr:ATP-binding cassette domain-containing protein [Isoptericola variabilis]AEG43282.1 ABC transporter related protein [Isoptericola variabilis 225]TWH35217.1 ABC-type dipeptide/oligopeptide/nickel transport system ATPase subunit [Isoptericola variabilis J7]